MKTVNLPYDFQLRDYQEPIWNAIMDPEFKRGVMVIPRRCGKDLLCWNALIAKAMQRVGLYFYMGPFYNQIRQIIWMGSTGDGRRFNDYIPPELLESKTKIDMRYKVTNGSQIKLQGSDNIDSIVGTNPIGIVFTEFSLHKPEAWEYLRPILAENGGWAIFNGTPRGLNHFYQLAEQAKRNSNWYHVHYTRDDTNVPTLEAIQEDRDSGMPESLIEQEYYCSWTSSAEETLIPLDIVQPAINRQVNEEHVQANTRVMGVDVAFAEKGDKAVIARRQGSLLHPLDKFQGLDNMGLASRVAKYIREWHPSVVFIDAGRGEGVISRLHQLGHGHIVVPVHFGGRTYSDLYNRKKDEIWCKMKEWIGNEDHPVSLPDDEQLITDLSAPMFKINDRGFIQIENKEQLKKRGFRSTDCGDAVALTFSDDLGDEPVLTKEMREHGVTQELLNKLHATDSGEPAYDPLSYMEQFDSEGVSPGFV